MIISDINMMLYKCQLIHVLPASKKQESPQPYPTSNVTDLAYVIHKCMFHIIPYLKYAYFFLTAYSLLPFQQDVHMLHYMSVSFLPSSPC